MFLVTVSEVNCYLASRYFVWDDDTTMDFMSLCSKLAWTLINNDFKNTCDEPIVRGRKRNAILKHEFVTVPSFARRWSGK